MRPLAYPHRFPGYLNLNVQTECPKTQRVSKLLNSGLLFPFSQALSPLFTADLHNPHNITPKITLKSWANPRGTLPYSNRLHAFSRLRRPWLLPA